MPAEAPTAIFLVHEAPGRVRFRVRDPVSPQTMKTLVERVAALGPRRVVGRPNTGSLIVETDEAAPALLAMLVDAGVAKAVKPPVPPPVRQTAMLGVMQADRVISDRTDGTLDLRSAMAVVFLGAAVYQLTRGRVFGPAATMLGMAFAMVESSAGRR
jgi:hypothetical protein